MGPVALVEGSGSQKTGRFSVVQWLFIFEKQKSCGKIYESSGNRRRVECSETLEDIKDAESTAEDIKKRSVSTSLHIHEFRRVDLRRQKLFKSRTH